MPNSRLRCAERPRRATGWGLTEVLVVVAIVILLLAIVCSAYLQAVKRAKQRADGFSVPEPRSQVAPDEMHCPAGWCGAPRTQRPRDSTSQEERASRWLNPEPRGCRGVSYARIRHGSVVAVGLVAGSPVGPCGGAADIPHEHPQCAPVGPCGSGPAGVWFAGCLVDPVGTGESAQGICAEAPGDGQAQLAHEGTNGARSAARSAVGRAADYPSRAERIAEVKAPSEPLSTAPHTRRGTRQSCTQPSGRAIAPRALRGPYPLWHSSSSPRSLVYQADTARVVQQPRVGGTECRSFALAERECRLARARCGLFTHRAPT